MTYCQAGECAFRQFRIARALFGFAVCVSISIGCHAREVVIGTVSDGPKARSFVSVESLAGEIGALVGDEHDVRIPADKTTHADWSPEGASAVLQAQLSDPDVDLIITTGLLTSLAAARADALTKPVISLFAGDPGWESVPIVKGTSGKRNFVYLRHSGTLDAELDAFHRLVGFDHVAILVDDSMRHERSSLDERLRSIADRLGVLATPVFVADNVGAALAAMPEEADAVYVAPLPRLSWPAFQSLVDGMTERKLPTFSMVGGAETENGILGSAAGTRNDEVVLSRRVALLVERILDGTDAGQLKVAYGTPGRLLLNLRTARAIDFSPSWSSLDGAELLYRDAEVVSEPIGLVQAMERAVTENLDLKTVQFDVGFAREDIRIARASLKPRFELGARYQRIDADRAALGLAAERSTDADIVASQVLYSEERLATYRIAEKLAVATEESYRGALLDTLAGAAGRYLDLLRASALEDVTRSNVEVTRTNLDLASMRERVGYSGRSEVLRWQSQIARDRQELAAAVARTEQAATALNNVLNLPLDGPVRTSQKRVDDIVALVRSPAFQRLVDTPNKWNVFQDYFTAHALANAPELANLRARLQAQARRVRADRRTFFVPEVTLEGRRTRSIDRSGAGALAIDDALGDDEWTVGVQLALPLYSGGARRARLARSRQELRQLRTEEEATREIVEARMRRTLQSMRGSFPAIAFAAQAADAARTNLALVTDQYQRGAVGVTDLVDAQETSLQAELAAAEARYEFLLDFVAVQRASGNFDLLLEPSAASAWLQDLGDFFAERGLSRQLRPLPPKGDQS